MTRFRWLTDPVEDGVPVRQVYGFCFDASGRLLLRDDGGRFGLPGGRPEHGESFADVLARECLEESQVLIEAPVYLGYQEVIEDGDPLPYAQLRMVARITEFLPRRADPDTARTYGRLLAPIYEAPALLNWGIDGLFQSAAAARAAIDELGVDVAASRDQAYRD